MMSEVAATAGLKLEVRRPELMDSAGSLSPASSMLLDIRPRRGPTKEQRKGDILSHAHGMWDRGVARMNILFSRPESMDSAGHLHCCWCPRIYCPRVFCPDARRRRIVPEDILSSGLCSGQIDVLPGRSRWTSPVHDEGRVMRTMSPIPANELAGVEMRPHGGCFAIAKARVN